MSKVYVILDPNFGERLKKIERSPVWITMSPVNKPVIQKIWGNSPPGDHLTGITGFNHREEISPENRFLEEIDTIDLHQGPYSTKSPYTILEVIGARLTGELRNALLGFGFSDFAENAEGFLAQRSLEEAKRMRN